MNISINVFWVCVCTCALFCAKSILNICTLTLCNHPEYTCHCSGVILLSYWIEVFVNIYLTENVRNVVLKELANKCVCVCVCACVWSVHLKPKQYSTFSSGSRGPGGRLTPKLRPETIFWGPIYAFWHFHKTIF